MAATEEDGRGDERPSEQLALLAACNSKPVGIGTTAVTGFEVEIPLITTLGKDGSPWIRLAPTYRWTPDGLNFGYTAEMWFNLPRTPFMIAPYFGGQSFRGNDAIVMGVKIGRFVRWGQPSP